MASKLDMALDDVIETSGGGGKGYRKGGGDKGSWSRGSEKGGGSSSWKGGKAASRGSSSNGKESKLSMSLDEVIESSGESHSKGGGDRSGDNYNKGSWWGGKDGGKSGGKSSSWGGSGWGGGKSGGKGYGGYSGKGRDSYVPGGSRDGAWEGGAERWGAPRYGAERWAPPPERWTPPSRGADGFDGAWAGGGGSSSSWRRSHDLVNPDFEDRAERAGGMRSAGGERYAGGGGDRERQGTRRERPVEKEERSSRHIKRIKVSNVPRDLKARDIKHAFEAEAGKTTSCELERGTAFLEFERAEDARKAVETFDRGELNGKTIQVILEA